LDNLNYKIFCNLSCIYTQHLLDHTDLLYEVETDKTKPRDYRRVAGKKFLSTSRKKRKSKKEIRRDIKAQLQYVKRDLKIIENLLSINSRQEKLTKRDRQLLSTIIKVYDQQKQMYDTKSYQCLERIVNIYQSHIRLLRAARTTPKWSSAPISTSARSMVLCGSTRYVGMHSTKAPLRKIQRSIWPLPEILLGRPNIPEP